MVIIGQLKVRMNCLKTPEGECAMKESSLMVATLMASSMRTAPKAGGKEFREILVVSEEE